MSADAARAALEAFSAVNGADELGATISDLLTDLMHLIDAERATDIDVVDGYGNGWMGDGILRDLLLSRAERDYAAERAAR